MGEVPDPHAPSPSADGVDVESANLKCNDVVGHGGVARFNFDFCEPAVFFEIDFASEVFEYVGASAWDVYFGEYGDEVGFT